jgi:hypothetical protein
VTWSTGLRVGCGEEAVVARETDGCRGRQSTGLTKGTDVPGLRMPALKDAGWRQMRRTKDDGGTLVSNIDLFGSLWGQQYHIRRRQAPLS